VRSFLGEGGRKKVYLAHDEKLDRDVAVAVIKTEGLDEAGLARVKREAQAMGKLGDHPNIVTIHDIGDNGGQPYIVSQYMAGGDLESVLKKAQDRRLSIPETMRISTQVVQGLAHAHSRGIIHRDLKPGNIWLTEDGTPKIGDFGLAVSLDRSRLTMEGMMVGTVAYMAPEQALGRQPDARSDLYSLGCVTYEMVTGRPPFLGDDPVAIISQHINTAPVAPSWHNPEVPRALEAIILRSLAKNPDERPESAAAIPEAFQAIVNSSSTTTAAAAESDANPLDRLAGGIFVGRDKEMDELRAGLEDALSGRGRLMMLVGEPGIGKTRTSEEFATYARLRNAQVVWGRCYEGEGAPAYWPWVQAIRSYVHEKEPQQLISEMGPGAADIAQVVSEVKERLPGLPVPPTLEPEQARFRLFDSITTFLKNASSQKPMVLVLDDLHWGDKPSLLLLQFLARELRGSRLLVLGTYRDVELRRQHPLSQTLGELGREGLSHRILLRGLSENDVARFVEITSGAKPPQPLVDAVFRETEGNPFFVNEVVRLLVADGRLDKPESVTSWSVTIPQGVREVVGRRLNHLSDECNRILTIGAVIGREFDVKTVEKVLAQAEEGRMTGDRLLEVLEEAVAARVINEVPGRLDWYSFSHALIRETLYEELSTARRVRAHRQIGEVLESDADVHLSQLAYHFAEAAQGGDIDKAIEYAKRAGERAVEQLAYEDAANHYERALQVLELKSDATPQQRLELMVPLGNALARADQVDRAIEVLERATALAEGGDSAEDQATTVLALAFAFSRKAPSPPSQVAEAVDRALARLDVSDSALRASLLALRSMGTLVTSSADRKLRLAAEALEMAERVQNLDALIRARIALYNALSDPQQTEERVALMEAAAEDAERANDRVNWLNSKILRLSDLAALGRMDDVRNEIDIMSDFADEVREPLWSGFRSCWNCMLALTEGRLVDAEKLLFEYMPYAMRSGHANWRATLTAQLFDLRRLQGRLGELEPIIKQNLAGGELGVDGGGTLRAGLTLLYLDSGRDDEARPLFGEAAANDFAEIPKNQFTYLTTLLLHADVARRLGDAPRAALLYDLLLPYADLQVQVGNCILCLGSASRSLGQLAATMGRWEDAERHFERAVQFDEKIGSRPWAARSRFEYAWMLRERGQPGDSEKALALVNQALSEYQAMGMKHDVDRAVALKVQIQGVGSDIYTSIDRVAKAVESQHPDLKEHAAPDGTVTIMFSDIEGSTEKTDRLGDKAWMDVLRDHNAIIREQLKAHGGFEVKSEGDGFMVAFQSAGKALACAAAIQRALAERNASAEEPVKVRMGLHAGEVIKEGEDFFGRNVIMAARVASQANGGEILASSVLKALLSGSDVSWGDSRVVALKGLPGEHEIWAVEWSA
jgi:class 3 adenylate cyclase